MADRQEISMQLFSCFCTLPSRGNGPIKLPLSVYQQVSKMAHKICLKVYIKLEGLKSQKLIQLKFSEIFFLGEKVQNVLQIKAFWFFKKFRIIRYRFTKAACLEKIQFFSCVPKCSQPVRLQESLIINISGKNQVISQIFT